MKKVLEAIKPLLKSKKVQIGAVTVIASALAKFVGLEPELASELAKSIVTIGLALIGAQAVADLGSGGRTSANYTGPEKPTGESE